LPSVELSERDLSAAILDAKFTSIERLEEVTTVMPVIITPRSDKNESQQKFKLFKSRKESMTVHAELKAKRE